MMDDLLGAGLEGLGGAGIGGALAGLGGSFMSGLGGVGALLGGGGSSASLEAQNTFDHSGWNVNFGAGSIDSTRAQSHLPGLSNLAGEAAPYLPYALLAAGVLIAWRMTRNKR